MGNEIGIIAVSHQGFLALKEVQVFRRILEACDGPDGNALPGLAGVGGAVEQVLDHAGHALDGGALAVFFRRDGDAPFLLGFQRDAEHLEAVTLKVFNEQQNGVGCSDYASPFSVIHLTKATVPEFGTPDLTMPAELRTIEANAFEGVGEIRAVDARNCTYIGVEAFKGCTELTQIMVDAECEIEEGAFSTEGTVWVYVDGAGAAKTFCDAHEGFEFVQVE